MKYADDIDFIYSSTDIYTLLGATESLMGSLKILL